MPTRPADSPGQFFLGVALALALLVGAGLILLLGVTVTQDVTLVGWFFFGLGPLMVGLLVLFARKQSASYWFGGLSTLVPGLLWGLLILVLATFSSR